MENGQDPTQEEAQAAWTDAMDSLIADGYIEQNDQEQVRLTPKGWVAMQVLQRLDADAERAEFLQHFESALTRLGFRSLGGGLFVTSFPVEDHDSSDTDTESATSGSPENPGNSE